MSGFQSPLRTQVVIIGAGPSGIGAARALFQAGIDPIILEARDRIGGRMWATKLTNNLKNNLESSESEKHEDIEVTIQLGANWIHGLSQDFNPMFERANLLNLALHRTTSDDEPGDDVILFDSGPPGHPSEALNSFASNEEKWTGLSNFPQVSATDYQAVLQRYYWIRERFSQFAAAEGGILSLSQSFDFAISCSENEFGVCDAVHRRCLNWIFDRIMIEWAEGSLDNLDAGVYVSTGSDGAFGEALVSGGYFQILEDLALEYPLTIELNHVVESVKMNLIEKNIEIKCNNGKSYVADYCIITIPVGVLNANKVAFQPSVPSAVREIQSKVTVGLMNLVWFLFPSVFWPPNINFFGVAREESTVGSFTTFLAPPMCDQNGRRQPILMCQTTGTLARAVETMTDIQIVEKVMPLLKSMFGQNIPEPCGLRHSSWRSDEFAQGSWCHLSKVGTTKEGYNAACTVGIHVDTETSDKIDEIPSSQTSRATSLGTVSPSVAQLEGQTDVASSVSIILEQSAQETLAEIDSKILYAGEAAHEMYRGTVHGAFLSGIREADRILQKLNQRSNSS